MRYLCLIPVLSTLLFSALPAQAAPVFDFGGYYKNLHTYTRSVYSEEDINANLNRLRLTMEAHNDPWQFYIAVDNEALIHDFGNTGDFQTIHNKEQDQAVNVDLDHASVDNDHLYLNHKIYRLYVKYYSPQWQAAAGKQAVDWGNLRFYSPADLFNPNGPLDLEYDERIGIDGVTFNYSPDGFKGVSLVALPGDGAEDSSYGLKAYTQLGDFDTAFIAANRQEADIFGLTWDGYLQDAGFRGEVTHTTMDDNRQFARAAVGLDYTFDQKTYGLIEYFYNGGADENNPLALLNSLRNSRDLLSLRKHLASLWWQYKFTPLIIWDQFFICDLEGGSAAYNPEINYNVRQNLDIGAGIQFYWGDNDTEFGDSENVYYVQLKWHF
ncbi:MAG: hypothetical protein ACLFPX_02270 [Candidatus Omnitrophota bacterium]